ncbi:hypothetical protein ARMA_2038 [Ardenticatena maritima]|uniref:Glycosyltransferase RgtA/B/C/D-like domain-containing protein n=1 Tax=Ardenticatena maritima TaxID=872965 RepID=A0A0M8K7Z1_9CHLR|nr:glycosyltransferase family 39 protein [Ardenticatena maritima]GAP63615.1 hypothetical protein ARMA_2038 [Ardenticatena maritima]
MNVEATDATEKPVSLAPRTYGVLLALFLAVAAWVRWQYAREISLFVDEFTTMWAAKRILELGVPRMPSGVLYTRGILASYVEAAFLAYRYDPLVARIPSILFALATIVTVYHVGRRQFGARVGLVAAALMVLAPEEIVWGARARFYMQLQLFVLLTAWVTYASVRAQDPRRRARLHVWFVVLFVLALFSQEETILLYPALVAAIVAWRGVRFFRHPDAVLAHVGAWIAMGVRYLIEKVGQPGYFETIQARRPYVGLIFDIRGAWEEYGPFFYEPARLVLTLFVLVALVMALREARRAWRFDSWRTCLLDGCAALRTIATSYQATLYYLWLFGAVFVVILLFVGQTWREMRYIFMIVPFWFLPAAAGIVWTWDRFVRSPRLREQGALGLAIVAMALFVPDAVRTLRQQVEGYDLALAYIAEHRQPGDAVLTPQPPACAAVFGPCDYYAIQKDYEEYVIRRDGVWVDRWTGAPLLNTVEQLEEVIRTHPHTYFLVDGYRLATRYEPAFVRMVVEQMDVVFMDRGIAVLRADGWRDVPPRPVVHTYEPPVNFKNEVGLRRVELTGDHVMPGETLNAMLAWTALGKVWDEYNVFFHLEAPDGSLLAQDDAPPVDGVMPTWLFHIGEQPEYPDEHTLAIPADAPTGRYRLQTGLYLLDTLERLPILNAEGEPVGDAWTVDYIWVGERPPLPPVALNAAFEGGLVLVAQNERPARLTPGSEIAITLAWRADAPLARDYTFFVQLLNADGVLVAQNDRQPEGGFYPTTAWDVGEVVQDTYRLTIPADAPPGTYRLIAGAYWWQTGERLRLPDGSDAVLLGTVEVVAP